MDLSKPSGAGKKMIELLLVPFIKEQGGATLLWSRICPFFFAENADKKRSVSYNSAKDELFDSVTIMWRP